jgi:nitroreductase
MPDILTLIRERRSARAPFDPARPVPLTALEQILEAARWSPTAQNMQNFEILVIDAKDVLAELGEHQFAGV